MSKRKSMMVRVSEFELFVVCLVSVLLLSCTTDVQRRAPTGPEVDLNGVLVDFEEYSRTGRGDPSAFCRRVESRGLYYGSEQLECELRQTGALVGFVNRDASPGYSEMNDEAVFRLEVEGSESRGRYLIASDARGAHLRTGIGAAIAAEVIDEMFHRHHRHYGKDHRFTYSYTPRRDYKSRRSRSIRGSSQGQSSSGRSQSSSGGLRRGK